MAVSGFFSDDALTHGAAIAYYAALSFAPLLVLILWSSGLPGIEAQAKIVGQINDLFGEQVGRTVDAVMRNAKATPDLAGVAGIVSTLILLVSASSVFGQLQTALNVVWGVKVKADKALFEFFYRRIISLLLIIIIAAVLAASLVLTAAVNFVLAFMNENLPPQISGLGIQASNVGIPFVVFLILFAAMYRLLPDVSLCWNDVWGGAAVTAALFPAGRVVIGWYIGKASFLSAYGAAASLLAFLVWVYYSSLVILFGAELIHAWISHQRRQVIPRTYAVRT